MTVFEKVFVTFHWAFGTVGVGSTVMSIQNVPVTVLCAVSGIYG